ncbi:type II secretion system protein [Lentisphaera marina]|uniref:type II secretion system protein n=1 Tax=Lentisphaera marina TaxID=1111041 RepID=UPI002366EF8E|nr:type II secretion system protein [Lentisphaera marina]MDD7986588.1 type II secretion system protein [Lentisphaera marina]
MTTNNTKKFTLIEVLVVVAIIGILASLLLPVLGKARKTSRAALSINNLKQIHMATLVYADNNNEILFNSDSNSHPRNNGDDTFWARMVYESSFGMFSLNNNDAQDEMASSSYNSMMFCPLLLAERDPIEHNASGRSSYNINRYFGRDQNDFTLNNLEGKIEPFIMPGTSSNAKSAHSATNLKHTEYGTSQSRPAYEYNGKSLALYLAGHVNYMTVGQGALIQDLVNDNQDFQ